MTTDRLEHAVGSERPLADERVGPNGQETHRLHHELMMAHAEIGRLQAERERLGITLRQLETENAQAFAVQDRLDQATTELAQAQIALERARQVHTDMLASLSWRVTSPLRGLLSLLRAVFGRRR